MDTPAPKSRGRNRTINIRVLASEQDLIDRAAEACGKTRSDFMLAAARREAECVLLDRRLFLLDEETYRTFVEQLDAQPQRNDKLRRLLATKPLWGA